MIPNLAAIFVIQPTMVRHPVAMTNRPIASPEFPMACWFFYCTLMTTAMIAMEPPHIIGFGRLYS